MKLISRLVSRPGATPGVIGTLLLLQLGLLRVFASASMDEVFVAGHALHWGCLFQQRFGFPCPTCGMTRSFLLGLHGNFSHAWQTNPAGLLLVVGMILFSIVMLLLMLYRRLYTHTRAQSLQRKIRFWTSAYAGLVVAVLMVHWVRVILGF